MKESTIGNMWLNRVSVLNRVQVLICGIEKNGKTVIDRTIATVLEKPFTWFPHNPVKEKLSVDAFKYLLQDRNSSWRKLVVYRDPFERFLSAYQSKCLLRDSDGRTHCHHHFDLNDANISIENIAKRLPLKGHTNSHWAPQTSFCADTVGTMWESYTHHVLFDDLIKIADVFNGRISVKTRSAILKIFKKSETNMHITNAKQNIGNVSREVRKRLFDFYKNDYKVFHAHGLYHLKAY